MSKHILTVLNYFAYFLYAPSLDELRTFFPRKISKKNLQIILYKEIRQKKLSELKNNNRFRLPQQSIFNNNLMSEFPRYTLPQYSIGIQKKLKIKNQTSWFWTVRIIQTYFQVLKHLPFVLFVGITGKSAMSGIDEKDDVDIFIITKKNLLWTTRFVSIVLAKILGIHTKNGVCLNLFFDESDITIPQKKQNSYVAHEILQMKPIIDNADIYRKFLKNNQWIYRYFPNAESRNIKRVMQNVKINKKDTRYASNKCIERLLKSIQLPIIIKNDTALSISNTQLWLFKKDFEKKLKRRGLVI